MSFKSNIFTATLFLFFIVASATLIQSKHGVEKLDEDNWERMLTGEWMVVFYAPWCPACKSLEPVWNQLASNKQMLNIDVGKIDVTDAPGLSGRFMVTALPTIYHVSDGIFRQYKSPRDVDSLVEFVRDKMWAKVEPIPSWKSPTSILMSTVSYFFRMSLVLRGIHNRLLEDFGLPTWGSYLIFAIATILVGGIIGLISVFIIDYIYPPKDAAMQAKEKRKEARAAESECEKSTGDDEIVENVKDDLIDEEDSESDKSEGDKDKDTKASSPNSPNVRKRKPRKAD